MGMELGRTPRLLQPRLLGRVVESLSSAEYLVSSAAGGVCESARLPWQLGLPSAWLQAPQLRESAGLQPSAVWTEQPSGLQSS